MGAIDGKHMQNQCPAYTGSNFISYKVDPNYKFLLVDIGNYGRHCDSGIFKESNFYKRYISTSSLPPTITGWI
uniref:DDE Tnp4 domain-containing protein n=1 Tax=Anopheles albimanus TaxID=7167 RepID=A0A182FT76_ANOAL